ncbi:MAG: non-ribosomal peptide synthetase, partial [Alphaproteobacteria bacterium]
MAALEGAPEVLELPLDFSRPSKRSYEGDLVPFSISTSLEAKIKDSARRLSVTPFSIMTAAFAISLARIAGTADIVLGVPVARRGSDESQELVGLLADTSVVRVQFDEDTRSDDLIRKIRDDLGRALSEALPFDALVKALNPDRNTSITPIFQAMIAFSEEEVIELDFAGCLSETVLAHPNTAKFDLQLQIIRHAGVLQCGLEYASDLFTNSTVSGIVSRYLRVLEWLSSGGSGLVSSVPLLDDGERDWVLHDVNATTRDYGVFEPVHQTIERVVKATPDIAAVRFEGIELSYGELWERSGILAHRLRRLGVGPEVRVGVALERSIELVVTLLAVLRAGGAYVPLDPELPVDRLSFMISDAAAPVVVTRSEFLDLLPVHDGRTLLVDGPMRASRRGADELPTVSANTLAYVIYTSGSTGQPKGVMNHHEGLRNRLLWMGEAFPIGAGDRVLQKTPYTFDVSVWEFFWPLMEGACLVVARPGGHRDPDYLAQVLQDEAVTVTHFVPSMLQAFLGHGPAASSLSACDSLRHVICSGEALPPALVETFYKYASSTCSLDNLYGPTEAAIDVTRWSCKDPGQQLVPIGHAVANTAMYVLDSSMEPVPVGVVGELWIGGVQVSRGYLGRPVLTACSFVADPHGGIPGARMYRTGDLGRRRPDGSLEYLGRIDQQVKLRGFRIELGEIESALLTHDAVSAAAVLLREDRVGDPRLVAYVVVSGGRVPVDLTEQLRQKLPEHMVPSSVVALSELPITANGKLDRQALPAPDSNTSGEASTANSVVRGPEEEIICAVFAGVLGRETVGPEENFFALGGHSLLAVQAISQLRNALDIELPANAVLANPTARGVARIIRASNRKHSRVHSPREFGEPRLASAAELRLRFLQQLNPDDTSYNMTGVIELDETVNLTALARALSGV